MTKKYSPFGCFSAVQKNQFCSIIRPCSPPRDPIERPWSETRKIRCLLYLSFSAILYSTFLRLGGVSPMTDTKIEEQDYVSVGTIPLPALGPAKRAATE